MTMTAPRGPPPDWHAVRADVGHRPFPPPTSPWRMKMSWCDLCFLHWPVAVDALRAFVPKALTLDLYEGRAWVAVVPFRMEHVSPRYLPDLPGISAFPELNVRVYVSVDDKPGVFFISLDATQPLAIWGARTFFHLNYLRATMTCRVEGDNILYRHQRCDKRGSAAAFAARYGPVGAAVRSQPGTLEHFLTERYCLYVVDDDGLPLRGHIQHRPWSLQPGFCDIEVDTMVPASLVRTQAPIIHFARRVDVVVWPLEPAA